MRVTMRGVRLSCGILIGVSGAACSGQNEDPPDTVEVGQLFYEHELPDVQYPNAVAVGSSAKISISTIGDGCTYFDSTEVARSGDDVIITPYDGHHTPVASEACTLEGLIVAHDTEVVFDTVGPASVVIHGRTFTTAGEQFVDFPFTISVE